MRMKGLVLAATVALLALGGCSKKTDDKGVVTAAAPVAAVPPPAGKKWSEVVAMTPEGGVRMGNPNAAIKLIEYASFTCPHCKRFAEEGAPNLRDKYVESGKVSWEFRSFLIHSPDPAVTLLVNCRGADPYFKIADQLFATQDDWLNKIVAIPEAEQRRMQDLPTIDQFRMMIEASGLYGFFAQRGLPRSKSEACIADQAQIDKLTAWQNRAQTEDEINSTPTFVINGQKQEEVASWDQLEPRLKAAGA